ncbi:MAG: acetoin dehydrogenase dihydrolipoyllysine-residue acetyltransferase subunit [Acidimicrobiia bacterium]|nr:acetoin dehydrogenase dihydrolipoyllysine-residue acetyltransferase subunit [Acidimicrobiia bacterium]
MAPIVPIVMPKWGLSMKEGQVVEVLVAEGDQLAVGDDLIEVDTDKISGIVEATAAGMLRRLVAEVGRTYPVKGLLGVVADESVGDDDIDAFVAGYAVPSAAEDEAEASAYHTIDVDGIMVRYGRLGGGERTVLLIHGYGGDLDNWLFTTTALAEGFDVVALDLPGHGQSAIFLPGETVADLARFVERFCEVLALGRVDVVGHSLGGAIAARLAIDHPDRVERLALIAPVGLGPEINTGYLDGFASARSRRDLKAVLAELYTDQTHVSREMVDQVLRYIRLDGVPQLLARLRAGITADDVQADQPVLDLDPAQVPLLVMWGSADRVVPAAHAAAAPAGAEVVVLEGGGHMVQIERPGQVNATLARHLRR